MAARGGAWRRAGRPVALCVLAATLLLWLTFGRAPFTSGQFTDYETDVSEAIWMTTHPADVRIVKTSDTAGVFTFTSDIPGCESTFSFTFTEAGTQHWLCNPVDAGAYQVTETAPGWNVGIECVESGTPNSGASAPATATIVLETYEKAVCTFTNEIVDTGALVVALDDSGAFTAGLAIDVSCTGGASPFANYLEAFTGSSATFQIEGLPPTGTTCNATPVSPPAGYAVDASDCQGVALTPVTPSDSCVIGLTALGFITIVQATDTGAPVTFTASPNFGACLPIVLDGGGVNDTLCAGLSPNLYEIVQALPDGWVIDEIDCGSPASAVAPIASGAGVSIDLVAGDDVTCEFRNTPE